MAINEINAADEDMYLDSYVPLTAISTRESSLQTKSTAGTPIGRALLCHFNVYPDVFKTGTPPLQDMLDDLGDI